MKKPSRWRRHLVAITGGIASGKSRVTRRLAQAHGLATIDVDQLARELLRPGQAGWLALEGRYGSRFWGAAATLDRSRLRRAIFADPSLRAEIDQLLHPLIREAMLAEVARLNPGGRERILVEVPLLYEAGWADDFSRVIVVWAPEEVCLARLLQRDGVSLAEARAAVAAQMPLREKAARADLLIDNSGPWEATCRQLEKIEKIIENS
ncbi:dephospho-CoA kinase [Desulfurivibrio sp. D14AmB]|uniref:dephospho-CoA kinase n=1 Tax=Desulfurivibrio sp. D14AmB TaxID=3374370 RepID=UPI00376EC716